MKIVTAPDVAKGNPTVLLFDLDPDLQSKLLFELLSILPDDAVIAIGTDMEWVKSFTNAVVITDKKYDFESMQVDNDTWIKAAYSFVKELNTNGHEQ